jgi:hypothetical protein
MRALALMMAAVSLVLTGCATPIGTTVVNPTTATAAANLSRTALDFAFNSFDAALSAVDLAVATGRLKKGSTTALMIQKSGREVQAALNAAETARQASNAAGYEAAFTQALSALQQFKALFHPVALNQPPLTSAARTQILTSLS